MSLHPAVREYLVHRQMDRRTAWRDLRYRATTALMVSLFPAALVIGAIWMKEAP